MAKFLTICFVLVLSILTALTGPASAKDVKIGVLANRGVIYTLTSWQQVAANLNAQIPGHNFVIIPLTHMPLELEVRGGQLDFVLVNPAQYIEFEEKYGASRIATLVTHVGQTETSSVGSVIFTRSNRTDIAKLSDLKGKSLATADINSFAAWYITRDELKRHGVLPRDLASVKFAGIPYDHVVTAVQSGEVDAGAVRTDVLEQMAREGKIVLSDFRILNPRRVEGFPFLLSSDLYPEFAFARLKHTDTRLANDVAAQLLLMSHYQSARGEPNPIGWTVPANYEKVRKLLQEWRLPPYQDYGKVTFREAISQHRVTLSLLFAVLTALAMLVFLGLNIKSRRIKYKILKEAKQKLDLIHAMIQATPDAVFIKDKSGRYVFVNTEAARIIGKPVVEIVGKDASEFFPPAIARTMNHNDSTVMSSASAMTYEDQLACQETTKCLLVTKGPMYDSRGDVDGVFVIARDITDLKLLQKEISEKVLQLESALATVRQLEGIIPICSYCHKIRDDEESWHQIEHYIMSHTEAKFSHGICPECLKVQMHSLAQSEA
jgi:PAS domain S-box-containing protein